eukprot:TRINITY_DN6130_c0_g1_i1.p1 TRINITY_DN6130_c0_g1~~TRINITY_DN6130_c0_g1_i1.p1  ORF type:complete len:457 (+),score=162.80 TRINITY_DN6130_c0_g1_i1:785-2155(+)
MDRTEELTRAAVDSMNRGLSDNALWCTEILNGMGADVAATTSDFTGTQHFDDRDDCTDDLRDLEDEVVMLMQTKEFMRAAHTLKQQKDTITSHKTRFLYFYSKWLDGEQNLQQSLLNRAVLLSEAKPVNPYSNELYSQLSHLHAKGRVDGYLLYLYGLILLDRGQKEDAMGVLLRAVVQRPLLWCAWQAIASVGGQDVMIDVKKIFPTRHWVLDLFEAHLLLRNYGDGALSKYQALHLAYPNASPVICSLAAAAYDKGDSQLAKSYYEQVLEKDPYRIKDIDVYSNTLYMHSEVETLSLLAHKVMQNQPYRPETQCILGNLYSLQKENEKAVNYFLRALQLNHKYHNAWTFLGHEYSPCQGGIGNVKACVFAYNRALELDPRDFRAWLGLAQTYYSEFNLPIHARYYAERSVNIRPNDKRLQEIANMIKTKAEMWRLPGAVIYTPTSASLSERSSS